MSGFSRYVLCRDCNRGFIRGSRLQIRCPECQKAHALEVAREYKRKCKNDPPPENNSEEIRSCFYTIEDDPKLEWHGRISSDQVHEGCRMAIFSEGTILSRGKKRYEVIGAPAPYPFMKTVKPQTLVKLPDVELSVAEG